MSALNKKLEKILIVEDDADILDLESDYLKTSGYAVHALTSGADAVREALHGDYALIILDIMLPEKSGIEICREIREHLDTPIILVTAKSEPIDVIRGLNIGSDDYITKPFDPMILVARARSAIESYRRHKNITDEITVGNIRISLKSRQVYRNGQEIKLANREYGLLCFLAQHPNEVFSKADLFEAVWGLNSLTDEATITVHINRIREKIEDNPAEPKIIETVWGVGYRFRK